MRGICRPRDRGGGGWTNRAAAAALATAVVCAAMAVGSAPGCGGRDGIVGPEGDSGPGRDGDADDAGQPAITAIEGTGPAQAVVPRPEDQAAFDSFTDKVLASQRIDSETRELVISGRGLSGATAVSAVGQSGQGTIDFEIQPGGTDTMLRVRFPQVLAVASGGLFLLTVTTPAGDASAQVFFLQGEQGPAGECSNTVNGDLTVTGRITTQDLTVTGSLELPDCPSGYARDPAADPTITVCVNAATGDEMVRVGDFWIDRYEVSIWSQPDCSGTQFGESTTDDYPASFPDNGNFSAPLFACSVTGVTPSRMMTWFQAQAACAASGKHLCTNAEWQAAAEGTHDPGPNPGLANPLCNTADTGPRVTGQAGGTPGGSGSCISMWGAEDMIGNLWEWTSDWWQAGMTWQSSSGQEAANVWGADYGGDSTWNVNGAVYHGGTPYVDGVPAAALRGGAWAGGVTAGVFALRLTHGPSDRYTNRGARCCRQR